MRTISTAQEDLLNSAAYDVHVRCEVENSTGGFASLSDLNGDWFESARWDWDLDQPVPELAVEIRRDHGTSTQESLAPLDEASTLNRDASTAYAPLLDIGREVKLFTACLAPGSAAPATSDMQWMFHGEIDEVDWTRSPMSLRARGIIMSKLQDRWVESSSYVYSPGTTSQIEEVLREFLSDWTDLSTSTLWESSAPGFVMNPWQQEKMRLLDAMTTIAQLIGWDLRERYDDASTAWRLRFEEPNRTATSSETDWTFGPQHYYDVHQMSISRADIRNVVSVIYGPASCRNQLVASDTDSIERYGRQWMEIEEASNSAIDSSSEANVLASAALADLKDPAATHEIEVPYWWPGELQDYYEFEANEIHYDTAQYLGVYGISHELSRDRHRTRIRVRGQPAGQYLRWQDYRGSGDHFRRTIEVTGAAFTARSSAYVDRFTVDPVGGSLEMATTNPFLGQALIPVPANATILGVSGWLFIESTVGTDGATVDLIGSRPSTNGYAAFYNERMLTAVSSGWSLVEAASSDFTGPVTKSAGDNWYLLVALSAGATQATVPAAAVGTVYVAYTYSST